MLHCGVRKTAVFVSEQQRNVLHSLHSSIFSFIPYLLQGTSLHLVPAALICMRPADTLGTLNEIQEHPYNRTSE